MTIPITIRAETTYATGDHFTRTLDVTVPPPGPYQHPADWAADELIAYTGEGDGYAGIEAMYEVIVIASPAAPELVGVTASGQG
ncbi:hypothetical protein [Gordonia sp. (in: high G+C Gram-positive bacteria)]|uniref:hypothetical protein n=1 Tax=Gordonia sp. (in: high G+C Gram-positive bacteria) TaxID=84139 RepID=UPI002603FD51|nr:hypothetical protein [Gordonia sp. (in: high G+C Gram-positive bacteria)]HMS73898.1 hypothetical protein [Gordonia sp. (in: high G+C Gram-positive bacteria)]